MCTIGLIIILWTSICLQDALAIRKPFEVVKKCPFNESEWKVRAAHTTCNGSDSYHCLLTEGGVILREQCTETSLFTKGFCPIFTNEGYLQWSPCKDTACPTSSYRSDEVYEYQICYRKTDKPKGESTEQGSNDSNSMNGVTIIVVAILLLFVLVLVFVVLYIRNQFGFRDKARQCITDLRICFSCTDRSDQQSHITDIEVEGYCHAVPLLTENSLRQRMDKTELPLYARPYKNKPMKEKSHRQKMEETDDAENGKAQSSHDPLLVQDVKENEPNSGKHDETKQKTEKLKELLMYPACILKQELSVNDVKEKVAIHSKSINEHFSESSIKSLQSIKDHNDYGKLEMSLVFALLRNFCDGIKSPSRGWDYEPSDDETHVGADIERIRFMWNKYCDNIYQFKHLDDVYNRMKQKYQTVAVHGDENSPEDFEEVMEKIQSIKLNPDCTVEKGIVITENITTALKILKSRNVVILKGVIGCGKTHALKAIQNNFQGNDWKTAWLESERFQDKISHEKPTILFCDNFFGRYGSNVFSQDVVNKTEKVLKEIESFESETKVVIGMHTHVYDEVKKNFNLNFLHQKNITVEMDNLSEAETLLIFKEQLKWGHCKKDPCCWFKTVGFQSVLGKITKNQGHIGGPFLSLMYCNQHELFSDETFSVNPIQTLKQHFQRMSQDSATLYTCLLYLMCVQEHNCDKDPETWAGLISADITNLNIKDVATTSSYVQMKTNEETLVHDILTIVLFKSAAEMSTVEIFKPVVERCKLGFMLQILRPVSTHNNDLYCGFMNVDKNSDFRQIGKIFVCRCVIEKTLDINHPLRTLEFVQKRFKKWQSKLPKWLVEQITM